MSKQEKKMPLLSHCPRDPEGAIAWLTKYAIEMGWKLDDIRIKHEPCAPPLVSLGDLHEIGESPALAVLASVRDDRAEKSWERLVFRWADGKLIMSTHPFEVEKARIRAT
jgi:hypothetical protein